MITVTCDAHSSSPIPVATEVSINGLRSEATGYLNLPGLPLGSIVELGTGYIVEWGVAPTPKRNLSLSSGDFLPASMGGVLQVHVEDDIRTMARRIGLDFDSDVPKHTVLYIDNPNVLSIHDVVGLLNRSPGLVEALRTAARDHFAIVSGTVNGDYIGLSSTYYSVSQNTLEIGSSYIHVSYSCSPVDVLGHRASEAADVVPLIIYLTPIRYDDVTARIALGRPALEFPHGD